MELRKFIAATEKKDLMLRIKKPVSTKYEIATLMKMLDGRPLLFENVRNFSIPVVANICSTRELVALGLQIASSEIIPTLANAISHPKEPKVRSAREYTEMVPDLSKLPILTYYPFDGGPYITSGIVVAHDREYGLNASYHRMMVIGKDKLVLRILPRDFNTYIERGLKEFAICIGNTTAVLIAAAISAGIGVNELAIANALCPIELVKLDAHTVPPAEIVMIAELTGEEHEEGPFLDLTETPDYIRKQRVARIKKIFTKKEPLFHAILPGGLEHKVLMGMPREPTIYREVAKVCEVKDVYITPGGASWLHGVVSIRKRAADDGRKAIEAAFAGHKSMKHVFVVDDDIDIHNPHDVEWAMATRFQGDRNMIIKREKGSSLDPSAEPQTAMTTKIGFDLTIPFGRDTKEFKKPPLPMKLDLKDYLD